MIEQDTAARAAHEQRDQALALMKAVIADPRPIAELYRRGPLEKAHRSNIDALTMSLLKDALSNPRAIPEFRSGAATENAPSSHR